MTSEEWAEIALALLRQCWIYGTQNDRRELLILQERIEAARQQESRHIDSSG